MITLGIISAIIIIVIVVVFLPYRAFCIREDRRDKQLKEYQKNYKRN